MCCCCGASRSARCWRWWPTPRLRGPPTSRTSRRPWRLSNKVCYGWMDGWIEQGNPKKTWTFFVHAVLCSCVMLCNARLCNVMLCQVVLVSSPYGCLLNTYFFIRCRVLLFFLNLYICLSSYLQSTSCM
jgi:hypothetical protein